MGKRPSNTLLYVVLSLVALVGLYIAGTLVLEVRDNDAVEDEALLN